MATLDRRGYVSEAKLYMAMELADKEWKLGFCTLELKRARRKTLEARDREATLQAIALMKERFGLKADAKVACCYEAGRDGHWIERWLRSEGVECVEIDSSSIEVERRARRVKTDRVDVVKLLDLLVRYAEGNRRAFKVVHIPTEAAEDERRLDRERVRLMGERTAHSNRIGGLLVSVGVKLERLAALPKQLERLHLWHGGVLGPLLKAELEREWKRYRLVNEQLRELEREIDQRIKSDASESMMKVTQLMRLRGIGRCSAMPLVLEAFGWRGFVNRREVGGYAGVVGTPHGSGDVQREQGIGKDGNARMRSVAVELSWMWLRYQPDSELAKWFERRNAHGGKRMRKVGIVAVARKLLVALWRYLEHGEVPAGALLKA